MNQLTRTLHIGLQTIRATAWPAPGGAGWLWSVSVCEPGHSRSGPDCQRAEANPGAALEEAERQGRLLLQTDWMGEASLVA